MSYLRSDWRFWKPRQDAERRGIDRMPLRIFLNEYVRERMHRAMTTNVSPSGLYVHRTFDAGHRDLQFGRDERFVQLEFELPGTSEIIWARGEVRYDHVGGELIHGTGIHITDIPRAHSRLLRDYVIELKRSRLARLLETIRGNRSRLAYAG